MENKPLDIFNQIVQGNEPCSAVVNGLLALCSRGHKTMVSAGLMRALALGITGNKLVRLFVNCGNDHENLAKNLINLSANQLNILANTNY